MEGRDICAIIGSKKLGFALALLYLFAFALYFRPIFACCVAFPLAFCTSIGSVALALAINLNMIWVPEK